MDTRQFIALTRAYSREIPPAEEKIDRFDGDVYGFLSNFAPTGIPYQITSDKGITHDVVFRSTEAFFQASKVFRYSGGKRLTPTEEEISRFMEFSWMTPPQAKKAGRTVRMAGTEEWDRAKDDVMREAVGLKFRDPDLAARLLATGDIPLVEGNTWGDRYWGVCNGEGRNMLGKILEEQRGKTREEWIRKMITYGVWTMDLEDGKAPYMNRLGEPGAYGNAYIFSAPVLVSRNGKVNLGIYTVEDERESFPKRAVRTAGLTDVFTGKPVDTGLSMEKIKLPDCSIIARSPDPAWSVLNDLSDEPKAFGVAEDFIEFFANRYDHYGFADSLSPEMTFDEGVAAAKMTTSAEDVLKEIDSDMENSLSDVPAKKLYLESLRDRAVLETERLRTPASVEREWIIDNSGRNGRTFDASVSAGLLLEERNGRPDTVDGKGVVKKHPAKRMIMIDSPGLHRSVVLETDFNTGKTTASAQILGSREIYSGTPDVSEVKGLMDVFRTMPGKSLRTEQPDSGDPEATVAEMDWESGNSRRLTRIEFFSQEGQAIVEAFDRAIGLENFVNRALKTMDPSVREDLKREYRDDLRYGAIDGKMDFTQWMIRYNLSRISSPNALNVSSAEGPAEKENTKSLGMGERL